MRIIDQLVYKITADTTGANKGLDTTGKKFDAVGKIAAAAMGVVTVGAVLKVAKSLGDLAIQSTVALDRVDKMSQKIGVSRQGFQEWDYILAQNGASVDGLQMSLKTLSTQAEQMNQGNAESTRLFERLGVEVNDVNGKMKDQEQLFNEVFIALSSLESETERTAIASKLLGRSATELAPAMNSGADAIEGLREQAHSLGLVYEDELIDAGVRLTDNLDSLKRSFEALKTRAVGPIVGALVSVTDKMLGQDSASERLEGALGKVKIATERYRDAQSNAVDPTNALTEAMKEQARQELARAVKDLSDQWDKSAKELEKAKGKIDDINEGIRGSEIELEKLKRDWEALTGELFDPQDLGGDFLIAYQAFTDTIIDGNSALIEWNDKVAESEKLRAKFVNALTEAYLDYDLDLTYLVQRESDLYDAVNNNIEAVRIQREATADAERIFGKMNVTTMELVEAQIASYEAARQIAITDKEIADSTAMLNLLYARQNELIAEEIQRTEDLNKKEALRKELIDNANESVRLANEYHKALGESFDLNGELTSIYTAAIKDLIDSGLDPADQRIADLLLKIPQVSEEFEEVSEEVDGAMTAIEKWGEAVLDSSYALKVTGDEQAFYRAMISDTQKAMIGLLHEGIEPASEEYQTLARQVEIYTKKLQDSQKDTEAWKDTTLFVLSEVSAAFTAIGALGDALSAQRLQALDKELQEELRIRGIAEDTEMERLQKRLQAAVEAGDEELQAEIDREMKRQGLREEYDDKKKQIQLEDARRQKAFAIFEAIINTASGIIKAIPNVALMTLASVQGALQLGAISAQPLPSFDVGSLRIERDMPAMVHKGEIIVPPALSEQARREGITIGPQGGQDIHLQVYMDSKPIIDTTVRGINSGQYGKIDARIVR